MCKVIDYTRPNISLILANHRTKSKNMQPAASGGKGRKSKQLEYVAHIWPDWAARHNSEEQWWAQTTN